ncbi:MAG: LCP family protein [Chloroflexi bacterium]|nr:LCP family protein [Chloroflexota bacterium]
MAAPGLVSTDPTALGRASTIPIITNTPIVVDIIVPTKPVAADPVTRATARAAGTSIAATATGPLPATPEPSPGVAAMPALVTPTLAVTPTAAPEPVTGQHISVGAMPADATTGLTPTEALSDTSVPPPVTPVVLPPGTINIALLGVDTRPVQGMANTDVIIIASINPEAPAVTLLSIPRDTLVYIPGWRSHKVNTAFAHGGPELFKQTIKYNFGINVDYYAMVNFAGIVNAVNTLDGVDIVATCPLYHVFPKDPYYMADNTTPMTVTQPYTDSFTGEVWQPGEAVPLLSINIPQPGVYTLNGLQALAYVRARYGVPGGDVDRGRREQRLIRALFVKAKQVNAIPKVPELYAQFQRDVKTDLTLENVLYFAGMAGRFSDAVIRSRYIDSGGLRGANLPAVGSVLIPNPETMQPYIQQALSVALNQRPNEGIPIEIWNGTADEDFGIVAADRLSELGFVITEVRQADEPAGATTIVDFTTTTKGSALPLLQRTFNIKDANVVAQPNKDGARYRIILGPDFNPCYYQTSGTTRATATPAATPAAEESVTPVTPAVEGTVETPVPQP